MLKYLFALVIVLYSVQISAGNQWQYEVSAQDIFDEIIENIEKNNHANDGLIYVLYLLNNAAAEKKLVELLRYYLGSATGHELSAAITYRGEDILPIVFRELENPITCSLPGCSPLKDIVRRLQE